MLNDATCFKAVYIVCGYTDLRSGMDRLAAVIEAQTGNRPYVPDTLYLFCGRRTDRIKGLVWEGDGWLLLYKRLSESSFQWPRNPDEVRSLTPQQFRLVLCQEKIQVKRELFLSFLTASQSGLFLHGSGVLWHLASFSASITRQ